LECKILIKQINLIVLINASILWKNANSNINSTKFGDLSY
jgi:hypothetical protein